MEDFDAWDALRMKERVYIGIYIAPNRRRNIQAAKYINMDKTNRPEPPE